MNTDNQKYEGKFVFLESIDVKNRYYSGEYLCVRATPATLYCVKPSVGYGGHEIKSFSLMGTEGYNVLESWEDKACAVRFATEQEAWAKQIVNPDFKRNWIESVYSGAGEAARAVKRCFDKHTVVATVYPDSDTQDVSVRKGVTKLVLRFDR